MQTDFEVCTSVSPREDNEACWKCTRETWTVNYGSSTSLLLPPTRWELVSNQFSERSDTPCLFKAVVETRVLPKPHVVIADLAHKRRRGSLPWASAADFDLQTKRRRLKSEWSHTFENYGTAIYWFIRRYEIRLFSTIKRHFAAHLK